MARLRYVGALLAVAFALGCGGEDEKAEVRSVIDEFAEAGREGDGEKVCEQIFAEALAKNVEREAQQSCASEVEDNLPEDEYELEIDSVEVNDDKATAAVTDQADNKSTLYFVKVDSDWRVLRVTPGT